MNCPKCGGDNPPEARFCIACGAALPTVPTSQTAWPSAVNADFAGFWLRFIAWGIDTLLLAVPNMLFNAGSSGGGFGHAVSGALVSLLIWWLYFSLIESSVWQASVGKKLLGLYVTDAAGRRLTFARASVRTVAKILSAMIFLFGFLMAGFTRQKQALHDILANTLVMRHR